MSAPLRVMIVEDEPAIRDALHDIVAAIPDTTIVAECGDGLEALTAMAAAKPDVVLLDIRIPGVSGIEVAASLPGDPPPLVVFVTAYDEYALKAFELNAVDYLLKPFDDSRVRATLQRVRDRLHRARSGPETDPSNSDALANALRMIEDRLRRPGAPAAPWTTRFLVSIGGRLRVVQVADVEWIQADDNYVRLFTADGNALLRETLKSLEGRLNPEEFARVHRSAMVRVARIKELKPLDSGDYTITLASGATTILSRSYRDALLERLR